MPAAHVRCEHDAMQQISSGFAKGAGDVEKLLQTIKSKYEPLKGGGWIGKGATAYFNEQESMVHPEMKRLADALQTAAKGTKDISKLFEDAAQEASSMLSF